MRVIICGAGKVGIAIAEYLVAEKHDVVMIDKSPDIIARVGDTLDVQAFVGNAAEPSMLEIAGAQDADMLIAATESDEVNMVSCQVASALFHVPVKLAKIRNTDYLLPRWEQLFGRDNIPVDALISTEDSIARTITRRVNASNAFDVIPLAGDKMRAIGIRIPKTCSLLRTPLRQLTTLFPDLQCSIVCIVRNEQFIIPKSRDYLLAGDQIYFCAATEDVDRAIKIFGFQDNEETQRVLVIGASHLGVALVEELMQTGGNISVTLIEKDRERAYRVAEILPKVSVLAGDVMDNALLDEVDVETFDTSVAITKDDELNTLATLMLKKMGIKRGIAIVDKSGYTNLVANLGVDVVISPRLITVSSIIQHIRRGRIHSAYALFDGRAELFEISALSTSSVVGKTIGSLSLPKGVIIGGIIRDNKIIMPRPDVTIYEDERVIVFARQEAVRAVEKLFSVTLEYF